MKRINYIVIALAALCFAACRNAAEGTYVIKGQVSDSLAKVPGVKALLHYANDQTDTADIVKGKFSFTGKADKYSGGVIFISTPDRSDPFLINANETMEDLMPKFIVFVVFEEGITEIFIGDEVKVTRGKLSSKLLDYYKKLYVLQREFYDAFGSPAEERLQDSLRTLIYETIKEGYEKNTDNFIGMESFNNLFSGWYGGMSQKPSNDEIIRYWDMASAGIKKAIMKDMDSKGFFEIFLSENSLMLGEDGKIVEKAS